MITFKDADDSIFSSRESTENLWHVPFTEICKISALDILNRPLVGSKEPRDSVYDTSEHFWKTKEYNYIGLIVPNIARQCCESKK